MAKSNRITIKDASEDKLKSMELKEFTDPNNFDISTVTSLTSGLATLSVARLSKIIFEFLNKWPNILDTVILQKVVASLIYKNCYTKVHNGRPIPESVLERMNRSINSINYTDQKPNFEDYNSDGTPIIKKVQENGEEVDEVVSKMRSMSVEEIIEWQRTLGIEEQKLKKQSKLASTNIGLFRMHASTNIRKFLNS